MKLKPTIAVSLFAIMVVIALNASAVSDASTDTKVGEAALQKKMKPHSHMEEKTGMPQTAPVSMPNENNAANDKTKHFHPRDGK